MSCDFDGRCKIVQWQYRRVHGIGKRSESERYHYENHKNRDGV